MAGAAPTLADWRERVREELRGESADALVSRTDEGLPIEPLGVATDPRRAAGHGAAGVPPWTRATTTSPAPPVVAPLLAGVTAGELADRLAAEATGGSSLVRLALDATLAGAIPGALPPELPVPLIVECGGQVLPAAALARALPVGITVDPLSALAAAGGLPRPLARLQPELALALRRIAEREAGARPLEVSTLPYHQAGAGEALELGLALATTAEYLRWLEAEGLEPAAAAPHIAWSVALGRDVFLGIAKLRAARLLWSKLLAACGVDPLPAPRLRAVVSRRTWTRGDPWVNLLRGTTQVFAALAGAADEITPLPFDLLQGGPSELGARLARNTVLILSEEGLVGKTIDPGGGAYAIEALTDAVARRAWQELLWVEGLGGLTAALTSGELAERLERSWSERAERFASGAERITGVTELRSEETEAVAPASNGARPRASRPRRSEGGAVAALATIADPRGWLDEAARAFHAGASLADVAAALPGGGEGQTITPLPRHRDAEAHEEVT